MSEALQALEHRKQAKQRVANLVKGGDHVLVVHYSSESFYEGNQAGRSPRITSVAVRHYSSGQTWSFSIQLVAERAGAFEAEVTVRYDEFERAMLDEFYDFVKENRFAIRMNIGRKHQSPGL